MNFMVPSRRDDLISLCYLITSMSNKGNLPLMPNQMFNDKAEGFALIYDTKLKLTPEILSRDQ